MNPADQPLVSVVTPVYNGAAYLNECIESVLNQTYQNWEYIIVNNASTDDTLKIANKYASIDKRVRVCTNETLLPIIANHNRAFSLISPNSKYCKDVSADDWLYPECLARMVEVAQANPAVGLVGSYQLSGGGSNWRAWRVRWAELPYPSTVIPGRDVCRMQMLGGPYVFGSPTSLLYRADLVREEAEFYPSASPNADTSACYKCLRQTDFGFVHQVLSYERIHDEAVSSSCRSLNSYESSRLNDLLNYGPSYLSTDEMNTRSKEILAKYYWFLGVSVFHFRDKNFWNYHKERLSEAGFRLSYLRVARAAGKKFLDLLLNPKQTVEKVFHPNDNNGIFPG